MTALLIFGFLAVLIAFTTLDFFTTFFLAVGVLPPVCFYGL
jgi:hypothetical protein